MPKPIDPKQPGGPPVTTPGLSEPTLASTEGTPLPASGVEGAPADSGYTTVIAGPQTERPFRGHPLFVLGSEAATSGVEATTQAGHGEVKPARPTWKDVVGKGNPLFRDLEMPIERLKEFGASDELISALKSQGVDYFWQLRKVTIQTLPRINARYSRNINAFKKLLRREVPHDLRVEIPGLRFTPLHILIVSSRDAIVTERLAYSQLTENQALVLAQVGWRHIMHWLIDMRWLLEEMIANPPPLPISFFWQLIGYSEEQLIGLGFTFEEVEKIKVVLAVHDLALNFSWYNAAKNIRQGKRERKVERERRNRELAERRGFNEAFLKHVDKLDLSVPLANALQNSGIKYVWQLAERRKTELERNFGRENLKEIKAVLAGLGLRWGMRLGHSPKVMKPELLNETLLKSIDGLGLSARVHTCLMNANIYHVWQLVKKTEAELLQTKYFGRKTLDEIKEVLAGLGLELRMNLLHFPKNRGGGNSHGNPTIHQGWEPHFHGHIHARRTGLHHHMAPDAHLWASGGMMGIEGASAGILEAMLVP